MSSLPDNFMYNMTDIKSIQKLEQHKFQRVNYLASYLVFTKN